VKTLHKAHLMRVIAALLVVAPLLGGITLEPLHLLFSAYGLLIWSALFVLHLPLGGAWPWDQHVGDVALILASNVFC
jgi:hypothetical protein